MMDALRPNIILDNGILLTEAINCIIFKKLKINNLAVLTQINLN